MSYIDEEEVEGYTYGDTFVVVMAITCLLALCIGLIELVYGADRFIEDVAEVIAK